MASTAFARTVRRAPLRDARKRCFGGPNQMRQPLARDDTQELVPASASFLASGGHAPEECSTANGTSASNWLADALKGGEKGGEGGLGP